MTLPRQRLIRRTAFPFALMLGFTALLFSALVWKVYRSDQDLGLMQLAAQQAVYAAESGIHVGLQSIHDALASMELPSLLGDLQIGMLERRLPMLSWLKIDGDQPGWFRLARLRMLKGADQPQTPLLDESTLLELHVEGRFGASRAHARAVLSVTDLVKRFAVVNSLNSLYYGHPLRDWIVGHEGFENFRKANQTFFRAGQLSPLGIIHDPKILHEVFRLDGAPVFRLDGGAAGGPIPPYGQLYARAGNSPCRGPLYCETPIVVDSHTFWGPVQTGLYVYRRGRAQPRLHQENSVVALPSSPRMQLVADNLEGDLPAGTAVDRDSRPNSGFLRRWKPDWVFLRALARRKGIYIDHNGQGFRRGQPMTENFNPEDREWVSENYHQPLSPRIQQDTFREASVCLSTATKFQGRNNVSAEALGGSRIIFSERSVQIRGDIGGDLMIVTPRQIFLTGPTNVDSTFRLFLAAKDGIAISTGDLEQHLSDRTPDALFVDAASTWMINAVLYNPGAGFFRHPQTVEKAGNPPGSAPFLGRGLALTITGACLEGDLQRWHDQAPKDGLTIQWQPEAASNLPLRPVSVNLLRVKIVSED